MKLKDILLNTEKGASELLHDAVAWLIKNPDLLTAVTRNSTFEQLRESRPAMVGFSVLADRLEDEGIPSSRASCVELLGRIQEEIRSADARQAEKFKELVQIVETCGVVTLSWSSTVLTALESAREHIRMLHVLESLPGGEGHRTADAARQFISKVELHPDADLTDAAWVCDMGIMGADTVFADGAVLNKVLSAALAETLYEQGKQLYVLASTWKRSPIPSSAYRFAEGDAGVFEVVPAKWVTSIITEV